MAERLDAERMKALFARCRGSVKTLLLDQKRIAGIGNIYACEALFLAGIGPRRGMHTLDAAERARLATEIHAVLDRAVEHRGTTISDFRDLDERPGTYGSELTVYGREGEDCVRCGATVRRIVQGGRSTFYCAACQTKAVGRRAASVLRAPPVPRAPLAEHAEHVAPRHALHPQQRQQVVHEVGGLLGQLARRAPRRRVDHLGGLLGHLPRHVLGPPAPQERGVGLRVVVPAPGVDDLLELLRADRHRPQRDPVAIARHSPVAGSRSRKKHDASPVWHAGPCGRTR